MDVEALLDVQPDLLVRLILHRRERMAEAIPPQLAERRAELEEAVRRASAARKERDACKAAVANLVTERGHYAEQALAASSGGLSSETLSLNEVGSEASHDQAASWLSGLRTRLEAMEAAVAAPAMKHLEAAEKAHEAMLDLWAQHEASHQAFTEADARLRTADSRVRKMVTALDECEKAIEYWRGVLDDGPSPDHALLREARDIEETVRRAKEGEDAP